MAIGVSTANDRRNRDNGRIVSKIILGYKLSKLQPSPTCVSSTPGTS